MKFNFASILLFSSILFLGKESNAQNIAINQNGAGAADCAILDVNSTAGTLGMLIPRVALTNVTTYAPVTGTPVDGVIVYSTAAPTGGGGTGFYYWSTVVTAHWVNLVDNFGSTNAAWMLAGNANTTPGTDFLGTTDNKNLMFKANALQSGLIDIAGSNAFFGYRAGEVTTGSSNAFFGEQSGFKNITNNNSGFGYHSLYNNTYARRNVAVGADALFTQTFTNANTAYNSNNVAVGYQSLYYNDPTSTATGINNTAVGALAMFGVITVTNNSSDNTAVGYQALKLNTVGNLNTAVGSGALSSQSFNNGGAAYSSENVAVGYNALSSNQPAAAAASGNQNTAVGTQALSLNTTGFYNTGLGYQALYNNGANSNNTAVGNSALKGGPGNSGANNTAVGFSALSGVSSGGSNTAVGANALSGNTSGASNVAVGLNTLVVNLSGSDNTALGYLALTANTVSSNTAVGSGALQANTTATFNTAVGFEALNKVVGILASSNYGNTALGYQALKFNDANGVNTRSYGNTAIGYQAMLGVTTASFGANNTAVGWSTLSGLTSGNSNSAFGVQALASTTSGGSNAAFGSTALYRNTGSNNVAVGRDALIQKGTGDGNTAVGYQAGASGLGNNFSSNSLFGYQAGTAMLTGADNNILIGYKAGDAITTGASNIVIGYDVDAPVAASSNQMSIGNLIFGNSVNGTGTTLSTGNVGICVSNPGVKLDILAANGSARVLSGGAGSYASISVGRTSEETTLGVAAAGGHWDAAAVAGDAILRTAAGALRFNTNNGVGISPLTILGANGNVGVGIVAPSEILHVVLNQNNKTRIKLSNSTSGTSATTEFLAVRTAANTECVSVGVGDATYNQGSVPADFRGAYMYSDVTQGITFRADGAAAPIRWVLNGSATPTEYMRISSIGNVGIGTNNPQRKLVVHGGAAAAYHMLQNNASGSTTTDGFETSLGVANEAFLWNYENSYMQFGTNNTARAIILANGNVGIGQAIITPGELLEVGAADATIRVRNTNDVGGGFMGNTWSAVQLGMYDPSGGGFGVVGASAKRSFFGFNNAGVVGSLTNNYGNPVFRNKLDDGAGNMCYTGTLAACSDVRYKKDINLLPDALAGVLKLRGVNYFWRTKEFPEKTFTENKQIGFIAQEMENVYPELVLTDESGYKSVDYSRLTPILVEAMKEQQALITSLQEQNDKLNQRLEKVEASLNVTGKR